MVDWSVIIPSVLFFIMGICIGRLWKIHSLPTEEDKEVKNE